ncbi:MAG: mechanosensitive ion channel domain-containing protein [Microcoleaceae cyanobacterium]
MKIKLPIFRSLLIAILTFSLILLSSSSVVAQFTFLPPTTASQADNSKSIWNLNRTYSCGEVICSNVIIDGKEVLTVASYPEARENDSAYFSADVRASKIQSTIRRIIRSRVKLLVDDFPVTQFTPDLSQAQEIPSQVGNIIEKKQSESNSNQQNTSQLPDNFKANSVEIKTGILNGETVIYAPRQPGITQQKILTVTRLDSLYAAQSIPDLAATWQENIQKQLTASIQERLEIANNPLRRLWRILRRFLFVLALSLAVWLVQQRVRKTYRYKRRELHQLYQSLQVDPESIIHKAIKANIKTNKTQHKAQSSRQPFSALLWNVPLAQLALSLQAQAFLEKIPIFTLKRQNILKQQQNFIYLVRILLFWVQLFLWFFGIASMFTIYPETRDYEQILLIQVIILPIIWLFVTLADRISDFFTDHLLNRWAEEEQLTNPTEKRYSLRVNTYSPAIKKATTTLFWTLGFFWTIQLLGVPTHLIASAGFIGLLVTYFSQNMIKDFFNGALILLTDRYVLGDVIAVGDVSGVVEKMNLYITELRNLNGELITIPNGLIGTVINMTKDWSRVNFEVVVAYDSDLDKVMNILESIAEEMQQESDWNNLFLEPLSILGVDKLDHTGITIRALIKTPPLQQWAVGREFRYRVKQAFDQAGINIGIPQQKLYFDRNKNTITLNSNHQSQNNSQSQSVN